ncbi:uncharacterized protein LOC127835133 [Dreissena polymorpha]|uniref:Methyltransferase FkbM domain-containing protein n=1 Tax=Dreissena polymorpha TaxID=45954 RepID=A0A9D4JDT0_DREPO|nr:uncharacterized protein LOC127835133 [Dreissena polymorpha]KAH3806089.1 hypothetical protein DPMN_134403 [Dreissena polymorpha]
MRFLRYSVVTRQYLMKCVSILYILFFIEFLFLNIACIYLMWQFRELLTDVKLILSNPYSLDTMTNVLSKYKFFREAVHSGKNGGFKHLMDYTLSRLYVENDRPCDWGCNNTTNQQTSAADPGSHWINTLRLDVSSSVEATFVMKQMQKYRHQPWQKLVVDIGANDGLMSSNSFNFIQRGWSAILVEPQKGQLEMAKKNLYGFTNQSPGQKVTFVEGVISDHDGTETMLLSPDVVSMETRVIPNSGDSVLTITVNSYSVQTFAKKYDVPKYFGILSIDAEGLDVKILKQWMDLDFRPMYIIVEFLHQPNQDTGRESLEKLGYHRIGRIGFNHIYEYDITLIVS